MKTVKIIFLVLILSFILSSADSFAGPRYRLVKVYRYGPGNRVYVTYDVKHPHKFYKKYLKKYYKKLHKKHHKKVVRVYY